MKRVIVQREISVPPEKVWRVLKNPDLYPKYVPFMREMEYVGPFSVGVEWVDRSTVFWGLPVRIWHRLKELEEGRRVLAEVRLPLEGVMTQEVSLKQTQGNSTLIKTEIDFHFPNKLISWFLEPMLEFRVKEMVKGTIDNLADPLYNKQL